VNLTGVFLTLQAAAAIMKPRRRGAMVITSSTHSYDGEALLTAYNASKAGLLGLLHTAANELGPYGIRVNAVCPGLIRTRLTKRHFSHPEVLKEYFRRAIGSGWRSRRSRQRQRVPCLGSSVVHYWRDPIRRRWPDGR
jgi:NAD(P)-dependent dehydrogenase (short-subunit alcohol dehydrogenase family)